MATSLVPESVLSTVPSSIKSGAQVSTTEIASEDVISSIATKDGRYLVTSPYTEQDHLLDLESVDDENRLLAKALVIMSNLRDDYATAPYIDTFNWTDIIQRLRYLVAEEGHSWKETSFYIVVFRSQIPPTTAYTELSSLDKGAHAEANASGGFLKYWFGNPDEIGQNLATCIWRSRHDAIVGGQGPAHRKASGATRKLYTNWKIDRHRLIVRDGVQSWEMAEWID